MLPQEILMILGVLRRILVHSEAYREAHYKIIMSYCMERWKPSPSGRVNIYYRSIIYAYTCIGEGSKFEVWRPCCAARSAVRK